MFYYFILKKFYIVYFIVNSADDLDTTDGPSSSKKLKSSDLSLKIKMQNKVMFKYRDFLKTLPISTCKQLLEYNKQKIPESDIDAVCC